MSSSRSSVALFWHVLMPPKEFECKQTRISRYSKKKTADWSLLAFLGNFNNRPPIKSFLSEFQSTSLINRIFLHCFLMGNCCGVHSKFSKREKHQSQDSCATLGNEKNNEFPLESPSKESFILGLLKLQVIILLNG